MPAVKVHEDAKSRLEELQAEIRLQTGRTVTRQDLLTRLIDGAYESREEVVASFRDTTVPLSADKKGDDASRSVSVGRRDGRVRRRRRPLRITIVVDTGVLYADHGLDASQHAAATAALKVVYDGKFGRPYLSDYVFDEVVTLTLKRAGAFPPARTLGDKLRGINPYPQTYDLVHVSPGIFDDAIEVFRTYDDQALSFTDTTTVAVCERHDIDAILSFDDDFDGVVRASVPGRCLSGPGPPI